MPAANKLAGRPTCAWQAACLQARDMQVVNMAEIQYAY